MVRGIELTSVALIIMLDCTRVRQKKKMAIPLIRDTIRETGSDHKIPSHATISKLTFSNGIGLGPGQGYFLIHLKSKLYHLRHVSTECPSGKPLIPFKLRWLMK